MAKIYCIKKEDIEQIAEFVLKRLEILKHQIRPPKKETQQNDDFKEVYEIGDNRFATLFVTRFGAPESTTFFNVEDTNVLPEINEILKRKFNVHTIYIKKTNHMLDYYTANTELAICL